MCLPSKRIAGLGLDKFTMTMTPGWASAIDTCASQQGIEDHKLQSTFEDTCSFAEKPSVVPSGQGSQSMFQINSVLRDFNVGVKRKNNSSVKYRWGYAKYNTFLYCGTSQNL